MAHAHGVSQVTHRHGGPCAQQLLHTGDPGAADPTSPGRWAGSKSRGGGEGSGGGPPDILLKPRPGHSHPFSASRCCRRDVHRDVRQEEEEEADAEEVGGGVGLAPGRFLFLRSIVWQQPGRWCKLGQVCRSGQGSRKWVCESSTRCRELC